MEILAMMADREPRTPGLPASFSKAEEAAIIEVMRPWPHLMVERLRSTGLGGDFSEASHRTWQDKFERELTNPDADPDTPAVIVWLAERGHPSAQTALRRHITRLLENGRVADLPTSLLAYMVRALNGLPPRPDDRNEVLQNMVRDIGLWTMVDVARFRWSLPLLKSSKHRHSAAWYVGVIMTEWGVKLSEKQVANIYRERGRLHQRLAQFLVGNQEEVPV